MIEAQNENPQLTNFQAASCTLDASVKIYSYRVDAVHTEAYNHVKGTQRGKSIDVPKGGALETSVGAHDVAVYLLDAPATRGDLVAELTRLMRDKGHPDD